MGEQETEELRLSSLASVTQGAGLFFIGMIADQGIGFLTNLVLTRTLGTQQYGLFTYLDTVFALVTIFTLLGSRNALLRFLPEYERTPRVRHAMMTLAYGTSLAASIVVASLIYYFAPLISQLTLSDPLFVDVLRVGAVSLPFLTLSDVTYSGFKAIERMDYNVTFSSVATPLARLVFVGGAAWLGYSVVGSAAGLAIGAAVVFVVSLTVLFTRTSLGSFARPTLSEIRKYYAFSVPLTFHHVGTFLYSKIDLLMVGFFLTGSSVGIYRIAVLLAGFLALPLSAFNQLFPPIASRLYRNGNHDELDDVYSTVTRWIFTLSLFPGCVALAYPTEVLSIFGEGFVAGSLVLTLFVFGQLANSVAGPSSYLLMMTGHQYVITINQLVFGVLNVILNYVLLVEYGFIGAAIATASVLVCTNVAMISEIWYFEGLIPYDKTYLWVVIAGLAASGVMRFGSLVLGGFPLLVVGSTVGGAVFAAIVWVTAVTDEDKRLFANLVSTRLSDE